MGETSTGLPNHLTSKTHHTQFCGLLGSVEPYSGTQKQSNVENFQRGILYTHTVPLYCANKRTAFYNTLQYLESGTALGNALKFVFRHTAEMCAVFRDPSVCILSEINYLQYTTESLLNKPEGASTPPLETTLANRVVARGSVVATMVPSHSEVI